MLSRRRVHRFSFGPTATVSGDLVLCRTQSSGFDTLRDHRRYGEGSPLVRDEVSAAALVPEEQAVVGGKHS
jgi:hypothetical protein